MPLVLALRKQRQGESLSSRTPDLHSEFQVNWNSTVRICLKEKKVCAVTQDKNINYKNEPKSPAHTI